MGSVDTAQLDPSKIYSWMVEQLGANPTMVTAYMTRDLILRVVAVVAAKTRGQ